MRKVKYHCATSVDGFVARRDGSFDCFAMEGPHVADFVASFAEYDVALMGRRTYELGLKFDVTDPYPALETYVFSRTMKESPDPKVTLVSEGATELVRKLKNQPGKDIWVVGAGDFASTLFAANLVDEVTVKVNPLLLGTGIPLVSHLECATALELSGSKVYENGVVLLSYRVKQQAIGGP